MRKRCAGRVLGGRGAVVALLVWSSTTLAGTAAGAKKKAAPGAPAPAAAGAPVSGFARVDGKELKLTNGYLLRAPDPFDAPQQNAVVLLTPQALDPAKLEAARTLFAAFELAPQRVVLEVKPDKAVRLTICHDGFGEGKCFNTPVAPFDWKPGVVEAKHVSGSAQSFAGKEDTVLETFKLYYEVRFDVTGDRVFAARR